MYVVFREIKKNVLRCHYCRVLGGCAALGAVQIPGELQHLFALEV